MLVTEVLSRNDPRGTSGEFDEAIAKEIVGLIVKKEFRIVVRQEIGEGAKQLGEGAICLSHQRQRDGEGSI